MSDSGFPRGPQVPRFQLGRCLITPGASEALARIHTEPIALLQRHVCGDWGEVDPEDASANEHALRRGLRLLSVYRLPSSDQPASAEDTVTVWVITEADRSATTLLLPEEY